MSTETVKMAQSLHYADGIWEQTHFGNEPVQIERDCKLVAELPLAEAVTLEEGKRYWITFKPHS